MNTEYGEGHMARARAIYMAKPMAKILYTIISKILSEPEISKV
jgi:hypothetical protein